MASKKRPQKVKLDEIHQCFGSSSLYTSLPTHSSGIKEPTNAGNEKWRADNLSRGDREDRRRDRNENNEAANKDENWRSNDDQGRTQDIDLGDVRVPKRSITSRRDDVDFSNIRTRETTTTAPSRTDSRPISGLQGQSGLRNVRTSTVSADCELNWRKQSANEETQKRAVDLPSATLLTSSEGGQKMRSAALSTETRSGTITPHNLAASLPKPEASADASTFTLSNRETAVDSTRGTIQSESIRPTTADGSRVCEADLGKITLRRVRTHKEQPHMEPPPSVAEKGDRLMKLINKKVVPSTTEIAEKTVASKTHYRKAREERESKRHDEEERRRAQKREEELQEAEALKNLILKNPEKFQKLEDVIKGGLGSAQPAHLLSQLEKELNDAEMKSLVPSIIIAKCLIIKAIDVLQPVWQNPSQYSDKRSLQLVANLVVSLKMSLEFLFKKSEVRRHKLRFLMEIQRFVHAAGFPRISGGLSLIEALWDSLYIEGIIEEQYYQLWHDSTDEDSAGRNQALFQLTDWFAWLNNALDEGQEETPVEADDEDDSL